MSSGSLDRTPNPDLDYVFQLGNYTLEYIPELPISQRFKFSAGDVWRWVQTMRREFDQDSLMSKVRKLPHNAIYIEKYGLPESLLDKIFSLRDHTKCLIDRFSIWLELNKDPLRPSLDLPICPVVPLREGVVIDALERLEIILWHLVSTDRHRRRNHELYQLACSLRGYSATLHGITKDVGGRCIGHLPNSWVGERCQKLAKWREDIARVSVVARPESIPPDWRKTVADVGDLASKIVATILDASGNVKVMTWEPDKDSVQLIREAMWRIGDWSEVFSVQADEPPNPANPQPPFPHIDLLAIDAKRISILRQNAPEQMEALLRHIRTFRITLFDSTSGIKYQVDECCRKWWAEARSYRAFLISTYPEVPLRPKKYDNQDHVEARLDKLETWLETAIAALHAAADNFKAVAETLATPPAVSTEKPPAERDAPDVSTEDKETKKRDIPKAEADILVREWLFEHAKDDPKTMTVRRISEDTGVSIGQFPKLTSWKLFKNKRDELRNSEPRTVPLDEIMIAKISESQAKDRKRNG